MTRLIYTALLLLTSISLIAQDILLLKNGDKVEFKNFKFDDDQIKLYNTPQGKMSLPVSEISGYCSPKNEFTTTLKSEKDFEKRKYYFVENILEGAIKLYIRTETSSFSTNGASGASGGFGAPGATTYRSSTQTFYIEKSKKYEELFTLNSILQNKKDKLEILKKYIEDDATIKAMLDDPEFKLTEESILRVIKAYNLTRFQADDLSQVNKSAVFFYLKDKGKNSDSLTISVNGNAPEFLPRGRPVALQLATNKTNKVCVNSYCELLTGSTCFIKYVEVLIEDNPALIRFSHVTSFDANRYLTFYRNNFK